jgi:hypothetical protein
MQTIFFLVSAIHRSQCVSPLEIRRNRGLQAMGNLPQCGFL